MVQVWTPLSANMGTSASKAKGEFTDWHAIAAPLAQRVARSQPAARPRIVGIAGSQGSGKSTLARIVVEHFREQGISATSVSLDDFYLTQAERVALADAVHPLLRTRGVPGTHDTGWLGRVVTSMQGQDGQQKVEL
jgi:D-glycerate 3-kinase